MQYMSDIIMHISRDDEITYFWPIWLQIQFNVLHRIIAVCVEQTRQTHSTKSHNLLCYNSCARNIPRSLQVLWVLCLIHM